MRIWRGIKQMAKQQYRSRIELLQGTLDLMILQTLQWGPQHGYGISLAIRTRSGEILQADTGSLYPALHRLEKQKWVASEWKLSENKQRAKYYRLTTAGKRQLQHERSRWQKLTEAIAGVLESARNGTES
jgi:PadR family transcriptional regulator, regulatory protein PadR